MAKQTFNVGDKIVFGRGKQNRELEGVTIGKVYEVLHDGHDLMFIDDENDQNYAGLPSGIGKATKIIE